MTSTDKLGSMRAVVLEMPSHWLEERRRQGADVWDEVWDGVLHMPPAPSGPHQLFGSELFLVLGQLVKRRALDVLYETGLYGSESNYRVPDIMVANRKYLSQRGIEARAEIVIEIFSPNDESREKLPFYADCGVREVWLIDPVTRVFEIRSLADQYATSGVESAVLGVRLETVDGPALRITWSGGVAEI